jgi:hypothetical protein
MRRPKPTDPIRVNVLVEQAPHRRIMKGVPKGVSFSMIVRFMMDVFIMNPDFRKDVIKTLVERGGSKYE